MEDSNIFKVGHENELFGEPERTSNKDKFNKKKAQKAESSEDMLRRLMHTLTVAARRKDTREHDEDETEYLDDQRQSCNPDLYRSYPQFNGGRSADGDSTWFNRQASSNHPHYQKTFTTTAAMESTFFNTNFTHSYGYTPDSFQMSKEHFAGNGSKSASILVFGFILTLDTWFHFDF